ncbi:MAG: hypothetical protein HN590_00200 [Calditrichaeota bacterium]|nr:hypothetical protein [Calditrichota bacterium]
MKKNMISPQFELEVFGSRNDFTMCVLVAFTIISLALSGCESSTTNPDDVISNLSFQVLSLGNVNPMPVMGATVRIYELNLYVTTDSSGTAYFENVIEGDWWVVAYKDGGDTPHYATDSVKVSVHPGAIATGSIQLDALPYFDYAKVNVHSFELGVNEEPEHEVRLKAKVIDPDGAYDINRVEWHFKDVSDTLNYNQDRDSAFYEIIIPITDPPSFDFPYSLGIANVNDFYFEAFDQLGNSTTVKAEISRIMDHCPTNHTAFESEISWWYFWDRVFNDVTEFNYLLRIYSFGANDVVYDTTLVPTEMSFVDHQIATQLEAGSYLYYIWVTDNFGNFVRSLPNSLEVLSEAHSGEHKPGHFSD